MSTNTVAETTTHVDRHRAFAAARQEPEWMAELRERAFAGFEESEWPTPDEEEWRRTDITRRNLDAYNPEALKPYGGPTSWVASPEQAGQFGVRVRVSGTTVGVELDEEARSVGVQAVPTAQGLGDPTLGLQDLFARGVEEADNRFLLWHYAYVDAGVVIRVPRGVELSKPVLVELGADGDQALFTPSVVVLLDEGAAATVVQNLVGPAETAMVANVVCHYRLGAASQLSLVDVQEAGSRTLTFAHAEARVARDAALRHFGGIFGASLAKSRVEARMTGPGAEAQLDGAYVAGETRHVDVRTVQRHVSPNTQSRAFYKGAVAQEGRSIYQGLIEVAEGARQTDAYLTNRNLVLNDGARADSIPSLQIKNNDVRCSHGSTTGKIDPAQLFYLTARGLSPRDARSMLINGYFADVIRRAPTVARERLLALVDAHIIDDEGDQDS